MRLYVKIVPPLLAMGLVLGVLVAAAGWGLAVSIIVGLVLIALGTIIAVWALMRFQPPDAGTDAALSPSHVRQ
jgi:F0F1-type ATP synthase assembly protein I